MTGCPYTLLVNTSDGFDDCWPPFFRLLEKFWPTLRTPVLLNTQRKSWSYPAFDIRSARVEAADPVGTRVSWSDCLLRCLDQVETPLVLYVQEDYFLERPVDAALIDEFAARMIADPDIGNLQLTHFGSLGEMTLTSDPRLCRIARRARYRISCQAALWRTDVLRSYLRAGENGWMFELYGTRRAWRRDETFLGVNRKLFNPEQAAVFQYTHTGIMKGRWHPQVPALFARHDIPMDFGRRGFYTQGSRMRDRAITLRRLIKDPGFLLRGILGR
jgi:hypothetical protein